ncbi:MAG: hypothetical protein ABI237_13385 [Ginsengibacter sp.]
MQKYFTAALFIFISVLLSRCASPSQNRNEKIIDPVSALPKDTFHLLCQYWELNDAEHPLEGDVPHENAAGVSLDPGIVFITDSTILENPGGEMRYGKFNVKGNKITASFDKGGKAVYIIMRLHGDELRLKRVENRDTSELIYTGTHTYWADAGKNPFSLKNYGWKIKPKKPETDEAIRNRVKGCVQFYVYYLQGYIDGGAKKIEFKSLPCCFNWYVGGITVQGESKLDKKWIDCFYSQEQAFAGRQMVEDVISKKYKWDEKETDWLKQSAPVLQQMHDSL